MNESLKSVLTWVVDFVNQLDKSLSDGWQWTDAASFFDEAIAAPGAFKEFPLAVAAVKAGFTNAQRQEYVDYVSSRFDLANDVAEEKVEAAFDWVLHTDAMIVKLTSKAPATPPVTP